MNSLFICVSVYLCIFVSLLVWFALPLWSLKALLFLDVRTSSSDIWILRLAALTLWIPGLSEASCRQLQYWLPCSQAFGLELNQVTDFPGFLACRPTSSELLTFHHYVNQLPDKSSSIYNLSSMYYLSKWHDTTVNYSRRLPSLTFLKILPFILYTPIPSFWPFSEAKSSSLNVFNCIVMAVWCQAPFQNLTFCDDFDFE